MRTICIIDTSIFLNILNVPSRNQQVTEVVQSFKDFVELGCTFILPMATIIETGNHIAQNGNGTIRRETSKRFCDAIRGAFDGVTPWQPSEFPSSKEIMSWLDEYPDNAGRNKSSTRTSEGTSFGDLSIIKEFDKCVIKFKSSEIFIWSLDEDLISYRVKTK